ncbi:MAG TPA: AsmA family protein, partial [Burkholderiales bacterium]|nr:AsmA family protein [Burkholderiales bacterium]
MVLFVMFGLGTLKGPIQRAVSHATGRELIIEGELKPVWSWVHPRFRAGKVRFANPDWADEDWMFQAEAVEASVRLLPLLVGRVVLPEVHLVHPEIDLEVDDEGRKNWILSDEKKEGGSRIALQQLTFDRGRLRFADAGRDIDLENELSTDADGVAVESKGTYKGLPANVKGRGGPVLGLKDQNDPWPIDAGGKIGDTNV